MKNMRTRKRVVSVALNGFIAILAILWLVHVFWLIISSFRAEQGAYTPYLWPKGFTFDNYVRALHTADSVCKSSPNGR